LVKTRYSFQRELIYNTVMCQRIHQTAETLHNVIKQNYPNISLGTVYRNLQYLSDIRKIKKITFLDNLDIYDSNLNDHYHAVCEDCRSITDIDIQPYEFINKDISDQFGINITTHNIIFYYTCSNCKKDVS